MTLCVEVQAVLVHYGRRRRCFLCRWYCTLYVDRGIWNYCRWWSLAG